MTPRLILKHANAVYLRIKLVRESRERDRETENERDREKEREEECIRHMICVVYGI